MVNPLNKSGIQRCVFLGWAHSISRFQAVKRKVWKKIGSVKGEVPNCWNIHRSWISGWWRFQIFFIFTPKIGGRFPFWRAYFSSGLKPPTSLGFVYVRWFFFTDWNPMGFVTIFHNHHLGEEKMVSLCPSASLTTANPRDTMFFSREYLMTLQPTPIQGNCMQNSSHQLMKKVPVRYPPSMPPPPKKK